MTAITDIELLETMRPLWAHGAVVLLRNAHGTMELRGTDLALKTSAEWITIYHASAVPSSERMSHLHLRKGRYAFATVETPEGMSPALAFWVDAVEHGQGSKPTLAVMFPAFYDWDQGRAPLESNQRLHAEWVALHGVRFELARPAAP